MAPFIPYLIAALAGVGAARVARSGEPRGPLGPGYYASAPVGYRRLRKGDRVTASMAQAQSQDTSLPPGVHHSHEGGKFMTAVENPTGKRIAVAIFVPIQPGE